MQPIPTPQVLDPDRVLANDRGDFTVNHEAPAALLNEALHATCSYAQQLWHDLDAMRGYLLPACRPTPASLVCTPPRPRLPPGPTMRMAGTTGSPPTPRSRPCSADPTATPATA